MKKKVKEEVVIQIPKFKNESEVSQYLFEAKNKLEKFRIAVIVSAIASVFASIGMFTTKPVLMYIGGFASLASIVLLIAFGGVKYVWNTCKSTMFWGWFVLSFPFDLISIPFTFILTILFFVCLPIIPVLKARKQLQNDIEYVESLDFVNGRVVSYQYPQDNY